MKSVLIVAVALCLSPFALCRATWYVPDDFPAGIQAAIDGAASGDTIIVRPGTYVENIDFLGKAVTVMSDQGAAVTVIDGNQAGSVVTFKSGEGEGAILQGFTLTNGQASWGGGVHCANGSCPTIRSNVVSENHAGDWFGGGIYCDHSSPRIVDNLITLNTCSAIFSSGYGGGIYLDESSPLIADNEICYNEAKGYGSGGGIFCAGASSFPMIVNNLIHGNKAYGSGGGISCGGSSPSIIANAILKNSASNYGGGGIYCSGSSPAITGNTISGNTTHSYGGGIYCSDHSSPTIVNNAVTGNSADDGGGGIACYRSSPTITGATITGNTTNDYGGGIHCSYNSSPSVTNAILWDNTATNGPEIYVDSASLTVRYSDVKGGWPGDGNIDDDPLFIPGPVGDYYLSQTASGQGADSPCLDTGNPFSAVIAGTTRTDEVQDAWPVDMGYHYPADPPAQEPLIDIKCNGVDQNVVVTSPDNVTLTIEIRCSYYAGMPVDAWVLVEKGSVEKWSCGLVGGNPRWSQGWCTGYFSGPLYDLLDVVLDRPLPTGSYKAWLALDIKANGNLNIPKVVEFDVVDFTVMP